MLQEPNVETQVTSTDSIPSLTFTVVGGCIEKHCLAHCYNTLAMVTLGTNRGV